MDAPKWTTSQHTSKFDRENVKFNAKMDGHVMSEDDRIWVCFEVKPRKRRDNDPVIA